MNLEATKRIDFIHFAEINFLDSVARLDRQRFSISIFCNINILSSTRYDENKKIIIVASKMS